MKKISRRSFLAASGLTIAALALTACGGSASTASSAASSVLLPRLLPPALPLLS